MRERKGRGGMENKTGRRKIITRAIIAGSLAAVILFVLSFAGAVTVYSVIFGRRFETAPAFMYSAGDFEGLEEEVLAFPNRDGTELAGYYYKCIDGAPEGLVVICHGFGGDANQFMDSAAYFAENGFAVFSFDVTGSGRSGGKGAGGFPQYTLDLMSAIDFAKKIPELEGLPVMVLGHSMGAYAAVNVFNFRDDVSAVALLAGFEKSTDLINADGGRFTGPLVKLFSPFVKLWENVKYGKYSYKEGIKRLVESDAGVLVAQSADDDRVPFAAGFEQLRRDAGEDKDFVFVELAGRGHAYVDFSDEAAAYIETFNKKLDEFKALFRPTAEETEEYIAGNLDRGVWNNTLDRELYGRILDLFEAAASDFFTKAEQPHG